MSTGFPKLSIVDTNVPINANLSVNPGSIPDDLVLCVSQCVLAIEHVIKTKSLVIDNGDEILSEYRHKLSLQGQPGVGDKFVKWIHDNCWSLPVENRVTITSDANNSYKEFPSHAGLTEFDLSDRKFVAVANAHPNKPTILQSTDSKWWGWKEALAESGIKVQFLCPEYSAKKHKEKMG